MTQQRPAIQPLGETVDRVLDKGVVVDNWARLSVVDLDVQQVTLENRMKTASLDTYPQIPEDHS